MAARTAVYLDFANGAIRELDPADTLNNVSATSEFVDLTDGPGAFAGNGGKFVKVNAGATQLEYAVLAGGGDMLSTNNLSDVADVETAKTNLALENVDNTSDANKPVSSATQTALDLKVDENAAITAATKTKITYDVKGLVTSGADATTADIADSANRRYVTDAQLTVIGNTSGTNTGDQTLPVKATGAEVDTGTDDAKFLTPKAIEDSLYIKAAYADGKVADAINDGTTTVAPSQNAVFDALALKAPLASPSFTGVVSGAMPRGHIWGLIMSNAADTVNDITVSAGEARNEAHTGDMILASPITKRLDAGWAVGDAQGGLNTGAEANSTWYEVHLIKRSDTGVVDVMFTTTANRATLPANYDLQRRIGWIRNDGSGNILQFTQIDDHFTLTTPVNDLAITATTSAAAFAVTAPPNSIVRARVAITGNTNVNGAVVCVISEIVEGSVTPSGSTGIATVGAGDFAIVGACHIEMRVSATSTLEHDSSTATGNAEVDLSTFGWIDKRLRLSST